MCMFKKVMEKKTHFKNNHPEGRGGKGYLSETRKKADILVSTTWVVFGA